ncbi:MAG: RraA family protein [Thermomicrobiales bacterium]|nr:RraA family protein [Thermomicrobiales bacterium]
MSFTPPAAALTAEQIEYLKSVDSPTIANAVEVFNLRDRTVGFIGGKVQSLFTDLGTMVGQALTVTVANPSGPVAGRDGFWRMWEALEQMPSPSVIVMQDISGEPSRCAYAGEVMATLARRLGAVGMVTDGGYRDVNEVHALGLHYFAAYKVVAHGNFEIVDVGVPVTLDGETINTGDILHGDVNGIVVVPAETLSGLREAVEKIQDRERRFMTYIKSDRFTLAGAKDGTGY